MTKSFCDICGEPFTVKEFLLPEPVLLFGAKKPSRLVCSLHFATRNCFPDGFPMPRSYPDLCPVCLTKQLQQLIAGLNPEPNTQQA